MVTPGYYRNADATRAAFTADGWFRSGDLGRLDDARLTLVGRSKDSIIVNGVNYFSHELETVLALIIHAGSWLPLTARSAVQMTGILLCGYDGLPAGGPVPRGSTGPG